MSQLGGRANSTAHPQNLLAPGMKDLVICCGYKGNLIKEYFRQLLPVRVGYHL